MVDVILHPPRAAYGRHDVDLRPGYLPGRNGATSARSSADFDLVLREPDPNFAPHDVQLYRSLDFVEPFVFSTNSGYTRSWVDRRRPNLDSPFIRNLRFTASLIDMPGHVIEAHEANAQLAVWRDPFVPRLYKDATSATHRWPGPRGRGSALRTTVGGNSAFTLGDLVSFGDDSLGEFPRNGTVSFWVRMQPGQADNAFVVFGDVGGLEFVWIRFIAGFPAITLFSATNGTVNTVGVLLSVADGGWHHVVCGADRDGEGTYFFYVDGVRGTNVVVDGTDDAQWLRALAPADPFAPMPTGLLANTGFATVEQSFSDLHIWQGRVLNEAEVKSLYADPDQMYARRNVSILIEPPPPPQLITADIDATAGPATTSLSAARVRAGSLALQAQPASTAPPDLYPPPFGLSGVIVHDTVATFDPTASTATASVSSTRVIPASATVQAGPPPVDPPEIIGSRVVQASLAVQASTATTSLTADRVVPSAIAAQASTATVDLDAAKRLDTALSLQSGTATVNLDADRVLPASLVGSAGQADAALTADRVIPTTAALQASTATVTLVVEVGAVISASVTAQASAATADLDATRISTADLDATAPTGTAAISATRVIPSAVTAQASAADAQVDATRASTASAALTASIATSSIAATRIVTAAISATAATATMSIVAELAGSVGADASLEASRATASLTGQVVHEASVPAQASTAQVAIDLDLVHVSTVAAAAPAATADLDATLIAVQGSIVAQAGNAAATLAGTRVIEAQVQAQAQTATASVQAQYVRQAALALQSGPAQAQISAARVRDGSLALQSGPASVLTDADLIHQSTLAALAGAATCTISGDPLTTAACALFAQRATAAVDATRVVTADIEANASTATCVAAAGQQSQGGVSATAPAAQADITATRVIEASLDLQASTATVLLFDYSRTNGAQAILLVAPFFRRVLEVGYVPPIFFKPGVITIESPHGVPARFLAPMTSG